MINTSSERCTRKRLERLNGARVELLFLRVREHCQHIYRYIFTENRCSVDLYDCSLFTFSAESEGNEYARSHTHTDVSVASVTPRGHFNFRTGSLAHASFYFS